MAGWWVTFFTRAGLGSSLSRLPTPAGGVQGIAVLMRGGIIEDVFDPPLDPLGGLGLGGPDGSEDVQDVLGGDDVHPLRANRRPGVGLERAHPLPGVFGVLPGASMGPDIAGRAGGKGGRCLDPGPARLDRINPGLGLFPVGRGLVPRLGQSHIREAAPGPSPGACRQW